MSQATDRTIRGVRVTLAPTSHRSSEGRAPDEKLFMRFPAVFRVLTVCLMRLSPRFRPRQLLIARTIGRAYAAANRRDFDLILMSRDPECKYHPAADLIAPDQDEVFVGNEGYLRMWRNWLDAFEDLQFVPEEVLDLGDQLLVTARQLGHGSASGLAVSQPIHQLFKIESGLVVWQRDFSSRSDALKAAGLQE